MVKPLLNIDKKPEVKLEDDMKKKLNSLFRLTKLRKLARIKMQLYIKFTIVNLF